ncbi:MAG: exodeoxyribonuclease VII small subunit [Bdellovibrionaceae bacterium]|jgi:exodeoxyribonuclease VII small subunit|nr:exodeoxyribonuclease VII small subunit [Pseudobdellovibrionaceae bacterium]
MDFEKKLNRLEEIVGKMEKGDVSLEESLKFFEEGVKLSRECNAKLTEAELKVKKLMSIDKDGNPVTVPFSGEEK